MDLHFSLFHSPVLSLSVSSMSFVCLSVSLTLSLLLSFSLAISSYINMYTILVIPFSIGNYGFLLFRLFYIGAKNNHMPMFMGMIQHKYNTPAASLFIIVSFETEIMVIIQLLHRIMAKALFLFA